MYHTCLYCTKNLGANEVLETLPIGRRIAFDSAQGRLWVVCRNCEKWNLVPFDTRLETIDICEHLFRSTPTRFSTANIGIAKVREGLELVRIGGAERPEFAAWRYGDQFGWRRTRAIAYGVAGTAAIGGAVILGNIPVIVSIFAVPVAALSLAKHYYFPASGTRMPLGDGETAVVSSADLHEVNIHADPDGWALEVPIHRNVRGLKLTEADRAKREMVTLRKQAAERALGHLLPPLNASGGSRISVETAAVLCETSTLSQLLQYTRTTHKQDGRWSSPLWYATREVRLGLEMLAHEESERKALAGELKLLEREWRQAEELAAIADALAVPEASADQFEQLRSQED